jgi:hypothetical protein
MNRARRRKGLAAAALLAFLFLVRPAPASAEGEQIHGENSSFLGQGVAMVWGILRGTRVEDTQAILRIALAGGRYADVSVEGVDPFTGERQELLPRRPLDALLDVWMLRERFADLPRREIHFFEKSDGMTGPASLTVYFMGLPDTTPEFDSERALYRYLEDTLARLIGGKGRTP